MIFECFLFNFLYAQMLHSPLSINSNVWSDSVHQEAILLELFYNILSIILSSSVLQFTLFEYCPSRVCRLGISLLLVSIILKISFYHTTGPFLLFNIRLVWNGEIMVFCDNCDSVTSVQSASTNSFNDQPWKSICHPRSYRKIWKEKWSSYICASRRSSRNGIRQKSSKLSY